MSALNFFIPLLMWEWENYFSLKHYLNQIGGYIKWKQSELNLKLRNMMK